MRNEVFYLAFIASKVCIMTFGFNSKDVGQLTKQPNIVFILADDLGWGDVGFHGAKDIKTPNIDALASEGIILNNYYVEQMCTPSRSALLTGLHPSHTGLQHFVIDHTAAYGLPLVHQILPQKLNELNYTSRMVGKWHLGYHKTMYTPLARGFFSFYGFYIGCIDYFWHNSSCDILAKDFVNRPKDSKNHERITFDGHGLYDNLVPVNDRNGEYLTHIFTEKAIDIIKHHEQNKPLFLYLAHHAVHRGNDLNPITSPPGTDTVFSHIKSDTRRNFAGSLKALDDSVGEIVEALQVSNMLNNTIIVFSSDNGAEISTSLTNGGSNWPLRGQKMTPWEGGVRSVGLIWYHGFQGGPRISNQLMHIVDWMPTLYHAAGGNPKTLGSIDGIDMWTAFNNFESPRKEALLMMDSRSGVHAIRDQRYKVIHGSVPYQDVNGWYNVTYDDGSDYKFSLNPDCKVANAFDTVRKHSGLNVTRNDLPIIVDCQAESGTICSLLDSHCLFDLITDPCERNNIAEEKPDVLEKLISRLEYYKSKEVPILNQPMDYLSNPDFHDGFWSPWKDRDETLEELLDESSKPISKKLQIYNTSDSLRKELEYLLSNGQERGAESSNFLYFTYTSVIVAIFFVVISAVIKARFVVATR